MDAPETPARAFLPTRRSLLSRLRDLEDDDSWRDFFETYWKLIYSAALKAGLSDADAQDVVQETVLTVTKRIGEFRYDPKRGSFRGWLLRVTSSRISDHLRRRKPHEKRIGQTGPPSRTEALEQLPDPSAARIEQVWETEWQQNLVDAAMQRIKQRVKPVHYQCFELSALKGWPPAKVAASLDVTVLHARLINHRIGKLINKEIRRLEAQGI